jgi:hypothetical protein
VRHHLEAFPIGLWGMLLAAVCWLVLPATFAPVERVLLGAACWLPRQVATWLGQPATAATHERSRLSALTAELEARVWSADVALADAPAFAGEALHCAVLAIGPRQGLRAEQRATAVRRGGGGQPAEITLDHTYAEVADCAPWVTKADSLIGLLQRAGVGAAAADRLDDPARVLLLNHPRAQAQLAAIRANGGELAVVVQAAAPVDPAPLRVELWNDPYRGARLDQRGLPVRTQAAAVSSTPAGLLLGTTRIWGYPRGPAGEALTLGVFVEPAFPSRSLSHVVLWRTHADGHAARAAGAAAAVAAGRRWRQPERMPAIVHDLPGASHGRHLVACAGRLPASTAVVADGLFLGTAQGLAFGTGLLTSFAASRQRWSLLLLPDDASSPPLELAGAVAHNAGGVAWFCPETARSSWPSGHLFTGSNGLHCPAGLWIGRAEPAADQPGELCITTPQDPGPRSCEVLLGGGS